MIQLSFSTISNCLQPNNSHNWLNLMANLKPEDKWFYGEGREAHGIIQAHVCNRTPDIRMANIKKRFYVVERYDFDPRCRLSFTVEDKVKIVGYVDGRDKQFTKFLEIKTSSTPWSAGKFQKSMQRKLYGLGHHSFRESHLITGSRKPEDWVVSPLKTYVVPVTASDRADATKWVLDALKTIEAGKFGGGLDEDGMCTDRWCYFGQNCQYKYEPLQSSLLHHSK